MTNTANLENVIAHLQEVQFGLRSGRLDLARHNLIKAISSLGADMSGHALDRGFTDRPGATVLDRGLELMNFWQGLSAGRPGAREALDAEAGVIIARLQEIVASSSGAS